MRNTIKKLLKSKLVVWGVIPLVLVIVWLGLTALYIIHLDTAFSVLSYNEPLSSFTTITRNKLLKGDSIAGTFTAEEDNLGIVALRFQTFFRPDYQNEDKLLFQIKEKGRKTWYYQNIYRDGLVYDMPYFPFGFPIIPDSKGKTYEFRITSLNGNKDNAIAISKRGQILSTKYKYTKAELLANKQAIANFVYKKIRNAIFTSDVIFSSFVYLLPVIFYFMLIFLRRRFKRQLDDLWGEIASLGKSKILVFLFPKVPVKERVIVSFFDSVLLATVLIDVFFLQLGNDVVYILIPILWITLQESFGVTSRAAFVVGIGMLFIPPIFLAFSLSATAEQAAVYAYLFLVTGLIQILLGLKGGYKISSGKLQ